jgi:DNA-directed RNA polymerase subunit alpha
MSQTETTDVIAAVEKAQPAVAELIAAREAVSSDADLRKKIVAYVASLSNDLASRERDKAGAIRRGLALWLVGREAEAADWLAQAAPKSARLIRGRCLVACGRPAAALEVLKEFASDEDAAEPLAESYANLGDADALRKLVDPVEKSVGRAAGEYFRGRLAEIEGEHESADGFYSSALDADPDHAGALFRLANHHYTFGDEEEAVDLFTRCVATPRPPVNAYLNLGNVYEDRGELSKALDCYTAVIELDPTNERARLFRGDALASLNMFYDEDLERRADRRSQVLRLPVTDFELSVRSRNCLAKMGVRTLGDLVQRTEQELLSYKNFGETSLQEIKDILAQKGLRLGMGREEVARDDQARTILEGIGVGEADRRKLAAKPLSELELSVRSRHCMTVLGLKTVGDLIQRTEAELMTIKNFGQTSLNEVKQKLAELGLSLAASTEPLAPPADLLLDAE